MAINCFLHRLAGVSNFNIIDDLEVLLLSQETNLPVIVVKFVSTSPLIHSIKLGLLASRVHTFHKDRDLGPLVLREQVVIVSVHARLQKCQLFDLFEEGVGLLP